ncbi:MAG: NUDIX domain-containing protein [Bacteroidia bacterium]
MEELKRFTIRVYGLLINEKKELLLVHENRNGFDFTKFPGGGLEFGEGTIDCLDREFMEETGLEIKVIRHFYTTDFFQPSIFNKKDQVISIYYLVEQADKRIHFDPQERIVHSEDRTEKLKFEWMPLPELNEEKLTLPIDKVVCRKLFEEKIIPH